MNVFNSLRCDMSCNCNYDLEKKISRFKNMLGKIVRILKRNVQSDTLLKSYTVMAVPVS